MSFKAHIQKRLEKSVKKYFKKHPDVRLIAVVGSVGKTSTKEMISSVLSQKYQVWKTQGNLNNEIGMPLTLLQVMDEHEVAVIEMGISDFGEMHRLGEIAKPDIVVMTNIGQCHLEKLIDRPGVLRAKTEILEHLSEHAEVILNVDDDMLRTIPIVPGTHFHYYGILMEADVRATKIESAGLDGIKALVETPAGEFDLTIPLPGEHNVYNALAAMEVGLCLGLSKAEIVEGIRQIETISGRSRFLHLRDQITLIDDCYNANPVSVKAGLQVLSLAAGRTIAVLGDMGELGEDEKALHYEVGKAVSQHHIDVLYTAGALSREIARAVMAEHGATQVHPFDTRDAMVEELIRKIKKGDTILIKASHFMEFSKVVTAVETEFAPEHRC